MAAFVAGPVPPIPMVVGPSRVPLAGAAGVAGVSRVEEAVDADQGEYNESPHHGAQLDHSPTPDQGAASLVAQNLANHQLDIREEADEEDPTEDLKKKGGKQSSLGCLPGTTACPPQRPQGGPIPHLPCSEECWGCPREDGCAWPACPFRRLPRWAAVTASCTVVGIPCPFGQPSEGPRPWSPHPSLSCRLPLLFL